MKLRRLTVIALAGLVPALCGAAPAVSKPVPAAASKAAAPAPVMPMKPADATVLPDGLAYKILKPGTGTRHPKATSYVTVHYTGWTTDGKMFDSSVARGEPATFPLNGVVKGWT